MSKIDLEQMDKNLQPTECYRQLIQIETHLKKLGEINSTFMMNKSELIKRMSFVLVKDLRSILSTDTNQSAYFKGLQTILDHKKELLNKVRASLELIEKEVVLHEEALGGYNHQYTNRTNE